jgi:hypothetical protein
MKAVKSTQRNMRLMTVFLDGTGTAALSGLCANDMALTDNGTGDYTLTFDVPFERAPQVFCTPLTDNIYVKVTSALVGSCVVKSENLSGTATDADFHVLIIGSDAADAV